LEKRLSMGDVCEPLQALPATHVIRSHKKCVGKIKKLVWLSTKTDTRHALIAFLWCL